MGYEFQLIKDTLICGSSKIACIFNVFVGFEVDVFIEREKRVDFSIRMQPLQCRVIIITVFTQPEEKCLLVK
jgi:hypothetical protein